jgi:hypothetical protein
LRTKVARGEVRQRTWSPAEKLLTRGHSLCHRISITGTSFAWAFWAPPDSPRRRRYWEAREDVVKEAQWGGSSVPPLWCGSDRLDPPREDYKVTPELSNLDGAAYESIVLGLFTIWRGQFPDRQKPNEVCVGYSRDGWSRPDPRGELFENSKQRRDLEVAPNVTGVGEIASVTQTPPSSGTDSECCGQWIFGYGKGKRVSFHCLTAAV